MPLIAVTHLSYFIIIITLKPVYTWKLTTYDLFLSRKQAWLA